MVRTFISYHTADRPIAVALKKGIEREWPGADVFIDSAKLRYGQFWQPALFEAIEKSDSFLVIVGNRLGEWQKVEYYACLRPPSERATVRVATGYYRGSRERLGSQPSRPDAAPLDRIVRSSRAGSTRKDCRGSRWT
jgi:TIR domain